MGDDYTPSCATSFADDIAVTWTAPADGCYLFDTTGSSFDTVLAVYDGCGGSELTCNDDYSDHAAGDTLSLDAGEQVVVAIDGYRADSGAYTLSVTEDHSAVNLAAATDSDLGTSYGSAVASGSSAGADTSLSPSCAAGSRDVIFAWTVPSAGVWTIDTNGSSYDTVLSVWQAIDYCTPIEVACDDDSGSGTRSQIAVRGSGGERAYIAISGYSGNTGTYVLNITH